MATINKKFNLERETKNTLRYAEECGQYDEPVIGTLYIRKSIARGARNVTVTVEIPE